MTSVIQFDHVSRNYGKTIALDQFSLDLPAGNVCALLGANGAGKTTAIRILLGLDRPQSGTSKVLGMESQKFSQEIRQKVGYVPDTPALYEWMTVEEIGWFTSGFYPWGYSDHYLKNIQRFGLDGNKKIRELSRGMRAKVSLALAISHQPELLVLDEPTSGLDPLVRREFLESMIDVGASGRSVFLCSHQVAEVERVADIVVILLNGKVACVERLDELKRSTQEVVITLPSETETPPKLVGETLAHLQFAHEHLWIVRNLDVTQLHEMCQQKELPPPRIRTPSLEEILLAMLREYRLPLNVNSERESHPLSSSIDSIV